MDFSQVGKWLIGLGIIVIGVGIISIVLGKLGFGKIPGDFIFQIGNSTIFIPLASFIIVSLLITVIANLIIKLLK